VRRGVALLLFVAVSGCFNRVADHCPGCTIVSRGTAAPPALPEGTRARVVLIGGGFGFGDEWRPVIAALRDARVNFWVFSWPGPFQQSAENGQALVRLLQQDLDRQSSLVRLVVMAHSAGGMLANWAVRQLRVPGGREVFLASIDAGGDINFSPFVQEERVNTPMGMAMGGNRNPIPEIPPGVTIVNYRAIDPPPSPAPDSVYLGKKVTHDESVALTALPLLRALSRPGEGWYR
jgi:pimeloyl-ACP methyl ester carboxylesterase